MGLCVSGDTNSHHGGQSEDANGMVNAVSSGSTRYPTLKRAESHKKPSMLCLCCPVTSRARSPMLYRQTDPRYLVDLETICRRHRKFE